MVLERFDYFESRAARVVRIVVLDLRTLEHETYRAIGQVDAHGHFGVALVRSVAEADKTAHPFAAIVEVVIGTFVEVRFAGVRMHQVVLFQQDYFALAHDWFPRCFGSGLKRFVRAKNYSVAPYARRQIGFQVARIRDAKFILDLLPDEAERARAKVARLGLAGANPLAELPVELGRGRVQIVEAMKVRLVVAEQL